MIVTDAVLRHQGGILSMEPFRHVIGMKTSAGRAGRARKPSPRGRIRLCSVDIPAFPPSRKARDQLIAEAIPGPEQPGDRRSLLGITRQAREQALVRGARAGKGIEPREGSHVEPPARTSSSSTTRRGSGSAPWWRSDAAGTA